MDKNSVQYLERQISALKSDRKNTAINAKRIKVLEARLKVAKTREHKMTQGRQY